jgi:cytochrome P450
VTAGSGTSTIGASITLEDLERDPYPIYTRLRAEEPVSWVPAVGLWLVSRWDDVYFVDHHPEVFTGATEPSTLNRTMGVNMLGSEGEAHDRIRNVVEAPFRPREVAARAGKRLEQMAAGLIDSFVERGSTDLLREFCEPFSVRSLRYMLGLDEIPVEDLARWNAGIMVGLANFEGDPEKDRIGQSAAAEARQAIEPILDRLVKQPDDSALSVMLSANPPGGPLTREEIVANTLLMLSGGLQEPRDLIALVVWALLMHPDALAAVLADPDEQLKPAIEETLRCYAPVGSSTRQTTRPTSLAGVDLDDRELVAAVLSSANRDERRFDRPDEFDIHRPRGAHLAFSTGDHFCLGAWLGRVQARVAVGQLLARLPGLGLDPGYEVVIRGWEFRAPESLHVRWHAGSAG